MLWTGVSHDAVSFLCGGDGSPHGPCWAHSLARAAPHVQPSAAPRLGAAPGPDPSRCGGLGTAAASRGIRRQRRSHCPAARLNGAAMRAPCGRERGGDDDDTGCTPSRGSAVCLRASRCGFACECAAFLGGLGRAGKNPVHSGRRTTQQAARTFLYRIGQSTLT